MWLAEVRQHANWTLPARHLHWRQQNLRGTNGRYVFLARDWISWKVKSLHDCIHDNARCFEKWPYETPRQRNSRDHNFTSRRNTNRNYSKLYKNLQQWLSSSPTTSHLSPLHQHWRNRPSTAKLSTSPCRKIWQNDPLKLDTFNCEYLLDNRCIFYLLNTGTLVL